jgi:hypothetical protein
VQVRRGDIDTKFHPAMLAAWQGDLSRFVAILDNLPDLVTARSSCSHPTLLQFVALDGGQGKIPDPIPFCQALIERGASLEEPLVAAAGVGAREILDCILTAGGPIEACAPWTPLEEAVYWAHTDVAEYLRVERKAAVRSLRAAAGLGDVKLTVSFFDGDRPRPDAGPVRFPWGERSTDLGEVLNQALVIAVKNGRADTTRFLLEHGAEVNALPSGIHEGGGALHMAALYGRAELIVVLLDHGADRSLEDPEHGATPAGWAEHAGFQELVRQLRPPPP